MGIFERCLKSRKWPIHWDDKPYHTIRYKGKLVAGNRNMKGRFDWLGIPKGLSGMKVLDIGCNAGEVAKECFDRGANVHAFDADRAVIELANQVHKGPRYYVKDVNRYPNGFSFLVDCDIVFCLSVINHVKTKKLLHLLENTQWKRLVFEGHQTTWNKQGDAEKLFKHTDWVVEFVGISDERLPRPLWIVKRS